MKSLSRKGVPYFYMNHGFSKYVYSYFTAFAYKVYIKMYKTITYINISF